MVYNKRTMIVMESINVRVFDYLTSIDSSKAEDHSVGSLHEEGNILHIPKDVPPTSDKGRGTVSTNVRTIPKSEHLVIKDARTIEDT